MTKYIKFFFIFSAIAMLVACGSSKNLGSDKGVKNAVNSSNEDISQLAFMQKVYDNEVYAKNIVADIDFTIASGEKEISVGGSLKMRKDDVIRIQLVAFGLMEVGRLEFTQDYVMIQDRYHKQYCKADYNNVGFLKDNGLDFFALQALLWNQLYVPGSKKITESLLKEFTVTNGTPSIIALERGNFNYNWNADKESGLIESVCVAYKSASHGSTNVNCQYSNFKSMGSKQFPSDIQLTLQTTSIKPAKTMRLGFKLNSISNSDKWENRTTPSSKYTEMSAEELLNNLMKLQ